MKITKISFKNINSFYGEHPPIDFTVNPLLSTGLFMISGATGAGKSTLLDVISLALFNQIPRFSVKSLNSKQIAANGSIINMIACEEPQAEAFAEVEYEVKGVEYRSRWSISKNRNGGWREYNMEVAKLENDEIISTKKSDAPILNEQLIGLKYNQFIQSIILSQGNFAEFLKAKEKERSKLLEDITGTHIYRNLGAAAFQKNKTAQEEIKKAEQLLENITLLSNEERLEKESLVTENDVKAKSLSEKREGFQTQLNLKAQLEEAVRGISGTKERMTVWETDYTVFTPQFEKLKLHLTVADLTKPINDLEHLQKALLQNKKIFTENQAEVKQLAEQSTLLTKNAAKLFAQPFTIQGFEKKTLELREQVLLLQEQINSLTSEGKSTADAIKKEISTSKDEFVKSLNPANYEQNIDELTAYETTLSGNSPSILEEGIEQLELLNTQFDAASNWLNQVVEIQQITTDGTEERTKVAAKKLALEELQKQTDSDKKGIEGQQAALKKLENQQEEERKKVNLEKLRSDLKEDEPCPLCGSTTHPYRQHVTNVLGELDLKIQEQKGVIKAIEITHNEQLGNQKVYQNQLTTHSENLDKLIKRHTIAKQKCGSYAIILDIDSERSLEELEETKKNIQQKRTAINECNRRKETLIAIRQLKEWSNANLDRAKKYRELDEQKKKLYTGNNIQQDCEDLLSSFRKNQHTIERIDLQNQQLTQQISEKETEENNAKDELLNSLKSKAIKNIEEAKKQLLTTENVNAINDQKESLQNQKVKLKTELEGFINQEQNYSEKITSKEPLEDLKNRVVILTETYERLLKEIGTTKNILDVDSVSREKSKSKLAEIQELRNRAKKWKLLDEYIGDANGNNFSNFAQSLTLNNLIGLANQRLKHLSDRYLLSKLNSDFDSLRIIDLYQGNAERSVDTLSGGETFTLSLAMALALSDMASQNVRLDSLFIDEGFGTLDSETLEAAIGTLERLQHDSKKTIGIISHRQELIERVTTQIKVEKGNDGKSKVFVTGV
jgi:exonuclease SbcC